MISIVANFSEKLPVLFVFLLLSLRPTKLFASDHLLHYIFCSSQLLLMIFFLLNAFFQLLFDTIYIIMYKLLGTYQEE